PPRPRGGRVLVHPRAQSLSSPTTSGTLGPSAPVHEKRSEGRPSLAPKAHGNPSCTRSPEPGHTLLGSDAVAPDAAIAACPHRGREHEETVLRCPETDLMLPLPGRLLEGKFRLIEQLGRGGMATVWLARHTLVDRNVAIKIIRPEVVRNEQIIARFRGEAKAAGRIAHRNACEILDFGIGPLGPYIVMERLVGQNLGQVLARWERLTAAQTVAILAPALEGLIAAHRRGIIHRDLKPENVFLHRNNEGRTVVKLMDFGVAKFTDGSGEVETEQGALLG